MEADNRSPYGLFRLGAIVLACSLAMAGTAYDGLVAYYARVAPRYALVLRPQDPIAIVNFNAQSILDRLVKTGPSTGSDIGREVIALDSSGAFTADDLFQMRHAVGLALAQDPSNAKGMRLLGQFQPAAQAQPFMEMALELNKRDGVANVWFMQNGLARRDYPSALQYVDRLLRSEPVLMSRLAPMLGAMLDSEDASDAVVKLLVARPPWMDAVLPLIVQATSTPESPMKIFNSFIDSNISINNSLKNMYFYKLVRSNNASIAYDAWIQMLPQDQLTELNNLFNGNFRLPLSQSPFDWVIGNGNNTRITIEHIREEGELNTLSLSYSGGQAGPHYVVQIIRDEPGIYSFSGFYKGQIRSDRGHLWRLTCGPDYSSRVIGKSTLISGSFDQWTPFRFDVTIPSQQCDTQQVQLLLDYRTDSEARVSGKIYYRGLAISRKAGSAHHGAPGR